MYRLDTEMRTRIVSALIEGCSIRATCRLTGAAKGTVLRLLCDMGEVCTELQDKLLVNLPTKRVQLDEIWAYVGKKQKNVPEELKGSGVGDVWTFTAIDADSKLVLSWLVGDRTAACAREFLEDVAARLAGRVQVTSDGWPKYRAAIEAAFGPDVDFAQYIKFFGHEVDGQRRYSPPEVSGVRTERVCGNPDPKHINTAYVERQNLTMRMSMRRFTRLTNGFSKKLANLSAAVSLHFAHYNLVRVHQTLRVTPAMAAGVTDHVWEIADLVGLLEQKERESTF